MRASVELQLPDGGAVTLEDGDLVGRSAKAALVLDDPRVSDAHAMVNLRGGALMLLSLRRRIAVEGRPLREVVLREGLRVSFAEGLELTVRRVDVPERVAALHSAATGTRLLGSVASIVDSPAGLRIAGRFEPDAAAHLWRVGEGWRLGLPEQPPRSLSIGEAFSVGAVVLTLMAVPSSAQGTMTRTEGAIAAPLRLVAAWDVAELHRAEAPPLVLNGLSARILSELVALGGSAHWLTVAGEVWDDPPDPSLRARWDVALNRLRAKLRGAGIRSDLVTMGGGGQVALVLARHDVIDDRT